MKIRDGGWMDGWMVVNNHQYEAYGPFHDVFHGYDVEQDMVEMPSGVIVYMAGNGKSPN